MATEIRMPRLSQTTDDVKLVSWLVKEGDTVKRGDPLCEVETDKAAMPVESYESGTVLKILGVPDTVIAAGTPIAILGTPGEKASLAESGAPGEEASPADSAAPAKAPVEKASAASTGTPAGAAAGSLRKPDRPPPAAGPVKATSLVRNVASKLGIDLAGVMGTGPGGLITKKDLEDFRGGGLKAVSLSKNQMVVSRSVARSKREAPHYYLKTTVLMDRALKWRELNRRQDGSKVSVYSLFVYSAARALRALPRLNGFFRDEKLVLFDEVNVGCAVTADYDLFVPVVRSADRKGILEIDRELASLVARARSGKLEPPDLLGGTFTLTNLGMYQVDEFCAVINPPQAGVLAIARAKKTLHVDDEDRVSIRTACTITGSFDHRVVNGAQGAEFMQRVKDTIEEHIA